MSYKYMFFILLYLTSPFYLQAKKQDFFNDSIKSRNLYFKGVSLARNSFYHEAIDTFKVSLIIRERLFGNSSYEVAMIHNALGINYKNIGNLENSIEHYILAEKAYQGNYTSNELAIARLYINMGNVYKVKLNFQIALDYFQKALEIYNKSTEISKEDIAEIYYNLSEVHYKLNNYLKVIEIIDEHIPHAYEDTKLLFLSLKAASLKELKKTKEAYNEYKKTIEYAMDYYSDHDLFVVFEYLNFATFLLSTENFPEAKEVLDKVNGIFLNNNVKEGTDIALYYRTWGIYYEELKVESKDISKFREQKSANLREAIKNYNNGLLALGLNTAILNDASEVNESTLSLTQSLVLLKSIADVYNKISDIYLDNQPATGKEALNKALEYYNITARLIQQARKSMFSDEDKIQLAELEEATFLKMIETAYKAYRMAPNQQILDFAFTNAERMKASSVFDRLSDQFAKENSLIPDSLTELERILNYNITSQNEKMFGLKHAQVPDSAEIFTTDSILFQLKKQKDELTRYLETNYRDYYEMKYANTMVSAAEVQKKLKSNEVLIEYVLNETVPVPEVYAFFFSGEKSGFHKLDPDSAFISHLEGAFRFVSNPAYLFTRNDDSKSFCVSANYLYQVLLKPFAEDIKHKKITIIPDGKLSYLPFDALLTEMPDTSGLVQFHTLPYLIRDNTVSYSYSANLLLNFKKEKRKARNKLLAFAPEYHSDTIHFSNERLILIPLPGVQREIELIAKEVKASLFSGLQATEKNFRENSRHHDILHLAMHAFINDSMPAFSRFAFTQGQDTIIDNDGWLNTADIYNLDLNSRLTVLSACNTGSGHLRKGEGVMSLARGFLYAGCPSIVMTLWEVEDNAGTEIMRSFYQILKKGRNTDDALRQAKLNYLESANPRMAHPHYWLSYVNIGSTEPLFRSYDFYFFGLLILALAAITADQFIRMKRNGRTKK
jgi:CHAT domain-containing protein